MPTAPEEAKTFTKTFIPDTVLDHDNTELLCVEIKRAHFDTSSVPQLQYLLIPAAMKNGVAFGLLICTKNAIYMKYYTNTVPKKRVMFQAAHFTLRPNFLLADMEELFVTIYCHLKSEYLLTFGADH